MKIFAFDLTGFVSGLSLGLPSPVSSVCHIVSNYHILYATLLLIFFDF